MHAYTHIGDLWQFHSSFRAVSTAVSAVSKEKQFQEKFL